MIPEERLESLGLDLPAPNLPVGSYEMSVSAGTLLFVSGHGAFSDGEPIHVGRLGESLATPDGVEAARAVTLSLLATVKHVLGDLASIRRCLKLTVFVNSTPDFTEQHLVANGASDLLQAVLGERIGKPSRSAIGVASLPLGFAVEIEAVLEVATS